jgi:hypothetical protein
MLRRILCVDPDDSARGETVDALRAEFDAPGPSIEIVTAGTVAEADADGELRIRGLDDQLGGWQPFTLPSG